MSEIAGTDTSIEAIGAAGRVSLASGVAAGVSAGLAAGLSAEDSAGRAGAVKAGIASLGSAIGQALAGTALIALCAHVSIPLWFTPVPVTLQPFAVLVLGLLMAPRLAAATTLAYLAEGAMGLPVFTPHGLGGLAQLLGPTGGYLLSYPLVAPLVSTFWRRSSHRFAQGLAIAGTGSLVTLAMGAIWLGIWTPGPALTVLNHAVVPFLPGDVLKVAAAAGIGVAASRWKRR